MEFTHSATLQWKRYVHDLSFAYAGMTVQCLDFAHKRDKDCQDVRALPRAFSAASKAYKTIKHDKKSVIKGVNA